MNEMPQISLILEIHLRLLKNSFWELGFGYLYNLYTPIVKWLYHISVEEEYVYRYAVLLVCIHLPNISWLYDTQHVYFSILTDWLGNLKQSCDFSVLVLQCN